MEKARKRIRECRQSLARSEYLVGYFYQKTRQAWRAAILRYEGILADYPDYDDLDEVLFRLSECLDAAGRRAEALPLLDRLLGEYPKSPFAADAQKLMGEITERTSAPRRPPPRPPRPVGRFPQAPPGPMTRHS